MEAVRRIGAVCFVFLLLLAQGCFRVPVYANWDKRVKLLSSEAPVTVRRQYRNYYALAGLVNLTHYDANRVIQEEGLVEVRVTVKDTIGDAIIATPYVLLLNFLAILPQTVLVEGNRACSAEQPSTDSSDD